MYDIGQIIGYPVEIVSYDVSNPDHDCVRGPDGKLYSICPMVSTGQIDKEDIEYIEKRLSDYLFPFENYSIDSVEGISVEDTSMFDR